jgi:hypothetical protein
MTHLVIEIQRGMIIGLKSNTANLKLTVIDYDERTVDQDWTFDSIQTEEQLNNYIDRGKVAFAKDPRPVDRLVNPFISDQDIETDKFNPFNPIK